MRRPLTILVLVFIFGLVCSEDFIELEDAYTVLVILLHTPVKSYVVKWPLEKWACHSHDDATPLSFHLQVTQVFF